MEKNKFIKYLFQSGFTTTTHKNGIGLSFFKEMSLVILELSFEDISAIKDRKKRDYCTLYVIDKKQKDVIFQTNIEFSSWKEILKEINEIDWEKEMPIMPMRKEKKNVEVVASQTSASEDYGKH